MPSKVIIIVNIVYVLGHKYVLGPSQGSESGPKHIYAQEHKLYCFSKIKGPLKDA